MTRVTTVELAAAIDAVTSLAYDPTQERAFRQLWRVADCLVWQPAELAAAVEAAAYGPGAQEVPALGHTHAGVDTRLGQHDPLVRVLQGYGKRWPHELEALLTGMRCSACGVRHTSGLETDVAEAAERAARVEEQDRRRRIGA